MLGDIVDLEFEVARRRPGRGRRDHRLARGVQGPDRALRGRSTARFLGGNPALALALDVLDTDRYGAGWLYAVEGTPDAGALDAAGYAAVLDATIDKMRDHL